jgi:diguanylate cyclase (GGDEF)-like protein
MLNGSPRANLLKVLTGRMDQCRRAGKLLGLILINVHRSRLINATHGYLAGDKLHELIIERLSSILRKQDQLVLLDHDEFAMILPGIFSLEHAQLAANRIQELLTTPFGIDGKPLRIQVGIGITLFPEHAPDAQTLLRNGDMALIKSMQEHTAYEFHAPGANDDRFSNLRLEEDLADAISTHDLELYFQPKVDLLTKAAYGAEALSRWDHAERGMISPDEFIAIAEQNGLMVPLTNWSLNSALRQYAACQIYFPDVSVAVNLSAKLLHDPDVVEMVRHAMALWNTPPEQLILEITESAMMTDPHNSLRVLHALHDIGIKLSIDDFGTGYSSLAYMKQLPVHELKIDKSFIQNSCRNAKDSMIVQSVIDLAHNFNMQVIAEGVEDAETFEQLERMGCDAAQGYYIARPMPAQDMMKWMKESPWGPAGPDSAPKS